MEGNVPPDSATWADASSRVRLRPPDHRLTRHHMTLDIHDARRVLTYPSRGDRKGCVEAPSEVPRVGQEALDIVDSVYLDTHTMRVFVIVKNSYGVGMKEEHRGSLWCRCLRRAD